MTSSPHTPLGEGLKPCPFCGSDALDRWVVEGAKATGVHCQNCGAHAITSGHWNMRSAASVIAEPKDRGTSAAWDAVCTALDETTGGSRAAWINKTSCGKDAAVLAIRELHAKSASISEQDIQRFRVGDVLFNDEQAKMFCDLALQGLRAQAMLPPSATASASPALAYKLRSVLNEYGAFIKHQIIEDAMLDAAVELERIQKTSAQAEWNLATELTPKVSGWRWIDYWTKDGLPGVAKFGVGDVLGDSVRCWRYRDTP